MNTSLPPSRVIRIFNPNLRVVRAYQCKNQTVTVGSGALADIRIALPSLEWVHMQINFDDKTFTALGHDIFLDGTPVPLNETRSFTDSSLVRLHTLVMGFYASLADGLNRNEQIFNEGMKYDKLLPHLEITCTGCSVDEDGSRQLAPSSPALQPQAKAPGMPIDTNFNDDKISEQLDKQFVEHQNRISSIISESYCKATGSIEDLEPVSKASDITNHLIEETKQEIKEDLKVEPQLNIVEAYINRKIENINEDIDGVINKDPNITLMRQESFDLGRIVLEKDLLESAKNEVHNEIKNEIERTAKEEAKSTEKEQIVQAEADLVSLDLFKKSITDNIKEEMREAMIGIVQEEVKEVIGAAVNECLLTTEVSGRIANDVIDKIDGKEEEANKEKLASENPADKKSSKAAAQASPKKTSRTEAKSSPKKTKNADDVVEANPAEEEGIAVSSPRKSRRTAKAAEEEDNVIPSPKKTRRAGKAIEEGDVIASSPKKSKKAIKAVEEEGAAISSPRKSKRSAKIAEEESDNTPSPRKSKSKRRAAAAEEEKNDTPSPKKSRVSTKTKENVSKAKSAESKSKAVATKKTKNERKSADKEESNEADVPGRRQRTAAVKKSTKDDKKEDKESADEKAKGRTSKRTAAKKASKK